jgi:hydroxymethylpyrimidine kinase/phosphomethylpyrimidine kinase
MQIALTIAGSDSGGGAGIQADLKTFQRLGVFGTSVVTAVTAQNTLGVTAVHPIPVEIVEAQLNALAADLAPAAIKSGMLGTATVVRAVAAVLPQHKFVPYILDPVMVSTSGARLLEPDAESEIRGRLVPLATLVTPNLDEAAILAGFPVTDVPSMERAGEKLLEQGAGAALMKGGHLRGSHVVDILLTAAGTQEFVHSRLNTTSTHGTGCTLSAAIAGGLAKRIGGWTAGSWVPPDALATAVSDALDYVHRAISTAPGLGQGHGPLNHSA